MARSAMVEEQRKLNRYQCGRERLKTSWLSSCSMTQFMDQYLSRFSRQLSWEHAIQYFRGNLDEGVLGFDHFRSMAVPRNHVGLPDCVAHLLSKGPKFIIGRVKPPKLQCIRDAMTSFKRQVLCAKFFEESGHIAQPSSLWRGLSLTSSWQPPECPRLFTVFEQMQASLEQRFASTAARYDRCSNLDAIDQLGLWWLKINDFIVVKDDKGSSLIPQRKEFKHRMCLNLASDLDQFVRDQPDRLGVFLAVQQIVPRLHLPRRVNDLLCFQPAFEQWHIHNIEYTWKSHKKSQAARCITPTTRSPLTPLAKVCQRRLKPVVSSKPAIVTCTRDVVVALDGMAVPETVWLGSGDIKDFYPSTCPHQACNIIRDELLEFEGAEHASKIYALIVALKLVLTNQYIKAGGETFRCLRIGQGLACASEVCDLVASHTIDCNPNVQFHRQAHMLWYGRFRDDCLVIWCGPSAERRQFEDAYNQANTRYKSTWEWSQISITFLDLHIAVHEGRLRVRTHFKPTNLFRYIPPWSAHPQAVFASWIQGELQRYIITNSSIEDFQQVRKDFMQRLITCGYSKSFVQHVFDLESCEYSRRTSMLHASSQARNRCMAFCVMYHPFFERMRLRSWLRQWQDVIQSALKSHPRLVVAYKRGQHLIHALRNGVK